MCFELQSDGLLLICKLRGIKLSSDTMTDLYKRDELSPSAFSGKQQNRFTCVFLTIIKKLLFKKYIYNTDVIDLCLVLLLWLMHLMYANANVYHTCCTEHNRNAFLYLFQKHFILYNLESFYWNYSPTNNNARVSTDNGFNSCHRDGFSQYIVCHLQAKELVFGSKNRACACAFVYYGNNMSLGQWYSIWFFV